jgi:hypothetical protein
MTVGSRRKSTIVFKILLGGITHWIKSSVGPIAGLDAVKKEKSLLPTGIFHSLVD